MKPYRIYTIQSGCLKKLRIYLQPPHPCKGLKHDYSTKKEALEAVSKLEKSNKLFKSPSICV